ncbi:MAG TPA: S9 family peptidase [Pyrinomonadaceae bacterium]|nr:S9 family peptidase [Pyrinomonadaceae bacterium]
MRARYFLLFLIIFGLTTAFSQQDGFNFEDLMRVKRVSDPQVSPDGRLVAYVVGTTDMASNKVVNQIFLFDLSNPQKPAKQLTSGNTSSTSPRWSPDGEKIAFVTGGQIWLMDTDGRSRKQITDISTGASQPVWSPNGKLIAFLSDVYPECPDDACNKKRDEEAEKNPVKAVVTKRLLYRHWNEWRDKKRTHVFIVSSNGGIAKDLTPGDFDSPPYAAASGSDFAFSPDSTELLFLKNPDRVEATSTNSDIFAISIDGGTPRNLTQNNRGYDASPAYTPDGKYIIYRSQATAGFESDRWRLMRFDRKTGQTVELTRGFDLQVDEFVISPDSKTIYFVAGYRGRSKVFQVPVEPDFRLRIATFVKDADKINDKFASINSLSLVNKNLTFLASSMAIPNEVFAVNLDNFSSIPVSKANPDLNLNNAEEIEWTGALGKKIHGFLLKPRNFDPGKKYPLLVLIHGGPQGAWFDNWGYRWNFQVFANAGYVVFLPNPRGSTTYGQEFVNDVSGDWGGKSFIDIKNGVAKVIGLPFIDKNRIGAAGASYGGYMIDWILGHNNDPRFRFKALVSHAGVYNLESMAASTEELWFVIWEFKGMPWQNRLLYERWSPHRFVKNFNTPTLVTAGELDFRVPVDQSLQLFTGLQMQGVDSKLIIFPDEGHWILKPQNSRFWYRNVLNWFAEKL